MAPVTAAPSGSVDEAVFDGWAWAPPGVLPAEAVPVAAVKERSSSRSRGARASFAAVAGVEPHAVVGDRRANDRGHDAVRRPLWRAPGCLRVDGGDESG